jgi:hypothetical protein
VIFFCVVSNVCCMCSFVCALYMLYIKWHHILVLKNTVPWDVIQCSILEVYIYWKLHNASHLGNRKYGISMALVKVPQVCSIAEDVMYLKTFSHSTPSEL